MNSKEECCLIPLKDFSVKCCKCYVDYWKSLRHSNDNKSSIIDYDYSIEKVKSFRKFFISFLS